MDDKKIIELFFARAEGAMDALAEKYGKGLFHMCRSMLGDSRDAEECVSDTYLALWNTIPPEKPEPLSAYLYRVGRNRALKKLRDRSAQKRSGYEVSLEELSECLPGPDTESLWEARELGHAIDRYLTTLSKENRVIFLRRYWFGDNLADLSRLTGLRENTLAVRLNRMRSALKHHLTKEGYFHETK